MKYSFKNFKILNLLILKVYKVFGNHIQNLYLKAKIQLVTFMIREKYI